MDGSYLVSTSKENTLVIPEGYAHKATSDGFNGANSAVIYYSSAVDRYLVVLSSSVDEDANDQYVRITKAQLELFIQSANDTVEMDTR